MKKTAADIRVNLLMGLFSAYVWQAPLTTRAEALGKIMPMGDSITLGLPVAGGYRDPLYTLLNNRGDSFTFVGSSTGNSTPTLTAAGQTHHEGWSGYLIGPGSTEDRQGMTLDQYLETWIGSGAESPDKILLMIGTNDINLGYDMANAPTRLSDLITRIYSYRPSVKLYVASIVPMSGHEADVQAFNAAIPGIVASHRALGRDVVYVPMFESMNSSTDFNPEDLLHPNALGYQHMAQAWDTALHATINLTAAITGPANGQSLALGATIAATATVANATGAYTVHVYTNSGSGAFAEVGTGSSASPYVQTLDALPAGTYHIYATVADTVASTNSTTNTFTVAAVPMTNIHAVDVMSAGDGAGLGSDYSVGWDFTVTQTIRVTALGQFDPDSNPKANTVALYRRGGAKLAETTVAASGTSEPSGNYSARYAPIDGPVLTPGNYVVVSTQNGDNFIAPNGSPAAAFGSAITWNKGVALSFGSAAGPLPTTAPANWSIENAGATRYFGPTFKYEVVMLTLDSPTNNQTFAVVDAISATATVVSATGAYTVHVYTNSGSGAYAEVGTGGTASPYVVNLGKLAAGTYHLYATISDTAASSVTPTNTFTVCVKPGQQTLDLTGWTQDIIIGASETAPGYNGTFAGWNFYESGLSGGTQGLAADSGANPRTFTGSHNPSVKFQFAPYAGNNAVYLSGPGNATLTLVNPAKFQSLQFLETTRSMSWYARLNFADGSSTTTGTWYDPDWTENPGPADWCLTSYGLRFSSDGGFYSGYLWMAEREFTLPVADQAKTLTSITICTTGTGDRQLAVFAVSGYVLDSLVGVKHAVDVTGIGDGPGFGDTFSVGWEFAVSQSIKITALGQFDPDSNPKANTVAIYRRAGAKLVEAVVSDSSPSELSGNYPARYAVIGDLILTPGEYVVLSTQNGDNFIAPGGSTAATFGPGITWTKCFALDWGSAAGPLPATALENWPIQSANAWRYFGPTFKYELVVPPPTLVLVSPTNNQALAASASIYAVATVADAIGAYTVHVYTNGGSGAFAEVGTGGSSSPYHADLGALPNGTYHIYASVADTLASSVTATNTFTVSVKTAQQTLGLTGWNYDIILGKTETAPGYNNSMADWLYYEAGLTGGSQGFAADSGDTPRTFTSARNPSIKFQFRPYTANNAVYLQGTASATLTLVNPAKFLSLQFLETTRTMSWYAKLNFADGSSTDTSTWSDPDWTTYPGPADGCLTSYGLRGTGGNFYANYLWMAGREFTLPIVDQAKTLTSITVYTLGNNGQQLALFAVSGYALAPSLDVAHAVDVNTINEGPVGGDTYSVGWDFTVSQTITVTALGQFDFDSNPQANTVAIYQRAGAKLAEVVVANDAPAEASGNYPARYAKIRKLILPPGDYVVFSTQNGDNFIASYSSDFGPAVRWNMGVALASGSAAGPLPAAAPTNWPIEDGSNPWRFFGPTFRYKMGAVWPEGTLLRLK